MTDSLLSPRCHYQLALATLLNTNNEIATEPESGLQYRLRALGGDGVNDAILIILDDIERSFEAEEDGVFPEAVSLRVAAEADDEVTSDDDLNTDHNDNIWLRLVSSGEYDNSVTVLVKAASDEDLDYNRNLVMTCPEFMGTA